MVNCKNIHHSALTASMNILNVGYDSTNYYLLSNPKPLLLVDAGWSGTLPKLAHSLKRYNLQPKDIPYIIATHYHPDHAGLMQEIKQQGTKMIVMENQLQTVASLGQYMKPENHYIPISLQDNLTLNFAESRAFLAKIGISGEIIPTPGHSDDSVTLILDDGSAFTGDLHPAEFVADEIEAEKARQSWERIRKLGGCKIYPGHGPVR
jgi:glyoxylase-like metal-dependent hydrolase (beta-lactamase superfamily II)